MLRNRSGFMLVACTMLLFTDNAAAEFSLVPILTSSTFVDDNRRLLARDGSGLATAVLSGTADARYRRPSWSLRLRPRARLTRNTSQKFLDAEDYFFVVGGDKQFDRDLFDIEAEYSRALSVTTELDELGNINAAVPRRLQRVNGSWVHGWSERVSSTLFGSLTGVRYDQTPGTRLFDYDFSSIGSGLEYRYSEQTTWLANAVVQYFDTPDLRSENFSFIYQFGIAHAFDETLSTRITVGQNVAKSTTTQSQLAVLSLSPLVIGPRDITTTTRGSGQVLDVSVDKTLGRNTFNVSWNRVFSPSSLGSRQRLEEVTALATRELTPTLTAAVRFEYRDQEQESVAGVSIEPRRRYETGIELAWRVHRCCRVTLDYQRARLDRVTSGDSADSNRITLSLRYRGDPVTRIGRKLLQ